MILKEWLKQERRSMLWLAKELGYSSGTTIWNWINQKAAPNLNDIIAIEDLTEGKVQYIDWLNAFVGIENALDTGDK